MARFDKGWLAVTRRIFRPDAQNNEFYGKGNLTLTWMTLIAWANIRDGKTRVGREERPVLRGEVITSLGGIARQHGLSTQNVRTALAYLEQTGKINTVSNRGGLHIRILNYEKYQDSKNGPNTIGNTDLTGIQHGPNTDLTGTSQHIEQGNKRTKQQDNNLFPEATASLGALPLFEADPEEQTLELEVETPAAKRKAAKSASVVAAYSVACRLTHKAEPKPNATLRSQACKLIDYLGADDAVAVAEYYVLNEREAWIAKARHPFGELLKNHQKYYTNWITGTKVSGVEAKAAERNDSSRDAIQRLLAREKTHDRGPPP